MDWTSGYNSAIEYTNGFYQEQSPSWLNACLVLNGIAPPSLDQFDYCELGCGLGLTSNILAATHPQGRFYAVDFNPSHIVEARRLAEEASIENITFLENSFGELAEGAVDLPRFDYISLHGIYTWVAPAIREQIVDFINRYLKPGGVVHISYNVMQGWASVLPIQRLLYERSKGEASRWAEAYQWLLAQEQAGARYFLEAPRAATWLKALGSMDVRYLVHEYLHPHWMPAYFADVTRDLYRAKLSFACSARLGAAWPELWLSPEQLDLVNTAGALEDREMLKDTLSNTIFRSDVFVRGARPLTESERNQRTRALGIRPLVPAKELSASISMTGYGSLQGDDAQFGPIIEGLASGTYTIDALCTRLAAADIHPATVTQIAGLLGASQQVALYEGAPAGHDSAARLNRALSRRAVIGEQWSALASPAIGGGKLMNWLDQLLIGQLCHDPDLAKSPKMLSKAAWQAMSVAGRSLTVNGEQLTGDEPNLNYLERHVTGALPVALPLWQSLGMLPGTSD